jgi:hypothetical protein
VVKKAQSGIHGNTRWPLDSPKNSEQRRRGVPLRVHRQLNTMLPRSVAAMQAREAQEFEAFMVGTTIAGSGFRCGTFFGSALPGVSVGVSEVLCARGWMPCVVRVDASDVECGSGGASVGAPMAAGQVRCPRVGIVGRAIIERPWSG